eukprot:6136-Rhodomonas_salina.2
MLRKGDAEERKCGGKKLWRKGDGVKEVGEDGSCGLKRGGFAQERRRSRISGVAARSTVVTSQAQHGHVTGRLWTRHRQAVVTSQASMVT